MPLTCIQRRTYHQGQEEEDIRRGFNPDRATTHDNHTQHNLDSPFAIGDEDEEQHRDEGSEDELGHRQPWDHQRYSESETREHDYGSFHEEANVWKGKGDGGGA